MCQLDGILLGMTINLFIKHDSACLYFPLPNASSLNCNFYHLFLYSRKNNPDESFHSLPYETLSSDPLKGNCSWKVWTVPVFSLILANIKPPLQKSYFYCHTLLGDFFPLRLFPVSFPCLLGHSLWKYVTLLWCSRVGGSKSGSYYQFGHSLPVWTWASYFCIDNMAMLITYFMGQGWLICNMLEVFKQLRWAFQSGSLSCVWLA